MTRACSGLIFAVFVIQSSAAHLSAQTFVQWSQPVSGNFSNGANWAGGNVPTTNQSVGFDPGLSIGATFDVTFDADQTNQYLVLRRNNVTLNLNGHTFSLVDTVNPFSSVIIADIAPYTGQLTINGGVLSSKTGAVGAAAGSNGSLTVASGGSWITTGAVTVGIGVGALTVDTGGSVNVGTTLGIKSGGTINLNGGALAATFIDMTGGVVNLNAGTLSVDTISFVGGGSLNFNGGTAIAHALNVVGPGTIALDPLNEGALTLLNGAISVYTGGTIIGSFDVQNGNSVTINGNNSKWTGAGDSRIGNTGSGSLSILSQGSTQSTTGRIGLAPGSSGIVIVDGAGSSWNVSAGLDVGAGNGTGTLNVSAGGHVTAATTTIGTSSGGTGSVQVNGSGSLLSNSAGIDIGAGGNGALNVQAGGAVASASATIGRDSGSVGTAIINGTGSTLATTGILSVGKQGAGSLAITAGGATTVGVGMIGREIGGNGSVTVNGAGSAINALSLFVGGSDSAAGGTGTLNLGAGGSLHVTGTLKVWNSGTVNIDPAAQGFDFSTLQMAGGTLTVPSIDLSDRTLSGYGTVNAIISGTGTVAAAGGNLTLGNSSSLFGFSYDGTIDVGAGSLTLLSKAFANLGPSTTLGGGTLAAPNGVFLPGGRTVTGFGTVNTRVAAGIGSTIDATGNLALGSSGAFDGFFSDGILNTGNHAVTINDRDRAVLGSLTRLGNVSGPGQLSAPNGILLQDGRTVVGYGAIGGPFKNQGFVQGEGPNAADKIEFTGLVTGSGGFGGMVTFSGGYSPGNSPARVFLENVAFSPTNMLTVELAGLTPGSQYDVLNVSGNAVLGGTLHVQLLDGLAPTLGDGFTVLTFASHSGAFNDYVGLTLGGVLKLKPIFSASNLTLRTVPALDGDVNLDSVVNIFDLNRVSFNWGTSNPHGDANGDGIVNIFDINFISANWTPTSGATAVPEPATVVLFAVGILGFWARQSRRRG